MDQATRGIHAQSGRHLRKQARKQARPDLRPSIPRPTCPHRKRGTVANDAKSVYSNVNVNKSTHICSLEHSEANFLKKGSSGYLRLCSFSVPYSEGYSRAFIAPMPVFGGLARNTSILPPMLCMSR